MIIKECLLINNKCYKAATPAKMTGIVVHDTGAGNPNLKRYVQAVPSQSYYQEVQADLGVNLNNNHWNMSNNRNACVHAFIGKNAKGIIETYHTLPYDIACWGVGDGKYGSYNYNPNARIQFEICDDGYVSEDYFYKAMKEAQEYCAYLCKMYGWNSDKICCHYESWQQGYGGNHSDITIWLKKFNKNMDWFRDEVQKLIDNKEDSPMTAAEKQEFEALKKKVDTLEKDNKIYHYFKDLPKWAQAPIKAMMAAGYFSGRSAQDLDLSDDLLRGLVIAANILKSVGKLKY